MKRIYLLWVGLLVYTGSQAQQELQLNLGDTLLLNCGDCSENFESVQWERATDYLLWDSVESADDFEHLTTVAANPEYFRAKLQSDCGVTYSEVITIKSEVETFAWSDPATWPNSQKPKAGEMVTIPEDKHIILDENTPELDGLIIKGILEFGEQDLALTTKFIGIDGGVLKIGTAIKPFPYKAVITLNDTDTEREWMGSMGTRGIIVMNQGILSVHGTSPNIAWTKINEDAPPGSTDIVLAESPDWNSGDDLIIGPTDFFNVNNGISITQKLTIENINGVNIRLRDATTAYRWWRLQYAAKDGLSLMNQNIIESRVGEFPHGLQVDNPKVLDQRAPVGNLTRGVVIKSPDDEVWKEEGFGAHIMIMYGSEAFLNGIEIQRGGQRGRLRRYPVHWHMLSYSGTETLEDAEGQFIINSVVNESENRGIVIHGTNGLLIQNNIVYKVKGHAIFTENAVERRNVFDSNLVLHVRNPAEGDARKNHERRSFGKGSSGFWISNPDNVTINNHVGDIDGAGYWLAFPERPFGESSEVLYEDGQLMNPKRMSFGKFEYNTAHSCSGDGLHLDSGETDEEGNTNDGSLKNYASDLSGRDSRWPFTTRRRFTVKRFNTWKNFRGIWDRAEWPNTLETVAADNRERCFAGSGFRGLIIGSLAVGKSFNSKMNNFERDFVYPAFASYHHTFDLVGNIVYNFPVTPGKHTGVFSTFDYYLRPVEKGHWLSLNNVLINSHPGFKLTAFQGWDNGQGIIIEETPHFNLAGAIWDPQGFWGPDSTYFVFDRPFYTHGLEKHVVDGSTAAESGGVSVEGPFYGIDRVDIFASGKEIGHRDLGLKIVRYNNNMNKIDSVRVYGDNASNLLTNMKDFALHSSGIYHLSFPENTVAPGVVSFDLDNFLDESDQLILGIEFTGSETPRVWAAERFSDGKRTIIDYSSVNSFNALKNSDGEMFWQDKASDIVWVKLKGGRLNPELEPDDVSWEDYIYEPFRLWVN